MRPIQGFGRAILYAFVFPDAFRTVSESTASQVATISANWEGFPSTQSSMSIAASVMAAVSRSFAPDRTWKAVPQVAPGSLHFLLGFHLFRFLLFFTTPLSSFVTFASPDKLANFALGTFTTCPSLRLGSFPVSISRCSNCSDKPLNRAASGKLKNCGTAGAGRDR